MKKIYECTNCQSDLIFKSVVENEDNLLNGYFECPGCLTNIPVVNGIKYFTEIDISYSDNAFSNFEKLSRIISEKRNEYKLFIKQKISKGMVDAYSAFQPFNESSRSFYPFIEELRKKVLKPGDVILDTWCRTGWTAYFLSALFPEQRIISIWEGNKDVLGYQGFDFWLSSEKVPENLEVIFTDINHKLPIKDNAVKLVYGLDTLHRYDQTNLVSELLRVTRPDGMIIWPHVHLTNSEPIPYFDRGEKQLHGTDYERFFEKLFDGKERSGFVVSEPSMFKTEQVTQLVSTPNTTDYNALIGILPNKVKNFTLRPYRVNDEDPSRLFIMANPYLKIDLNRTIVRVDRKYLNGVVGKMLNRHPIYDQKMGAADGFRLSDIQTKALYLSSHNYSFLEIVTSLNITNAALFYEVKELVDREIVHILPLNVHAMNLQAFHSAKSLTVDASNHTLNHLRILSGENFKEQPVIVNTSDSSELQKEDVNFLIKEIQNRLQRSGITSGDKIVIASKPHFEAVLTFWAASETGVEVCILSSEMPINVTHKLVLTLNPKLVFTDEVVFHKLITDLPNFNLVVFDEESLTDMEENLFSSWLEEKGEKSGKFSHQTPTSDSIAATLFTSGTTGTPKGIQLSHGALYRSGELLSRQYNWTSEDRLLMVSELDSMSGLRNTCVATQFTGTALVVPNFNNDPHVFTLVESIKQNQVTILTSTPALIKQLIQLGQRIKSDLRSLRQVICTGGNLSVSVVEEFKSLFGIKIINYYGLTETTGLCIGELDNGTEDVLGSIGVAVDSVAQVVDNDLKILEPGEVGRLRIFNDRLMSGYLHSDDASNLRIENGWLYTGDWAVQDEQGNFFLKGRERDIIKDQAGNIVYLTEVEECLCNHSKVKDVAVCGDYNESGEYLIAFVITQDEDLNEKGLENELKEYVSKELVSNKAPLKIVFTKEFKSNSRGKVDKKILLNSIKTIISVNE